MSKQIAAVKSDDRPQMSGGRHLKRKEYRSDKRQYEYCNMITFTGRTPYQPHEKRTRKKRYSQGL